MIVSRLIFASYLLLWFFCDVGNGQVFQIVETDEKLREEALEYAKDLIDDFNVGMERYLSITELKCQTAIDSVRLFESEAQLERLEDKKSVWMRNIWRTVDIADDRSQFEKTKHLPVFKNCDAEVVIVDRKLFELVKPESVGLDSKLEKPRLHKRQPYQLNCGFGLAPQDLPFAINICFTHAFSCDDLSQNKFAEGIKCVSATRVGGKLDTYWYSYNDPNETIEVVMRIVFEDRLPVLYEYYYSSKGYSLSNKSFDLRKDQLVSQVKTKWKRFDLLSVPVHVEAKFWDEGGSDGYNELFIDARVKFFPADTKEFAKAFESYEKLIERAKILSQSKDDQEIPRVP